MVFVQVYMQRIGGSEDGISSCRCDEIPSLKGRSKGSGLLLPLGRQIVLSHLGVEGNYTYVAG